MAERPEAIIHLMTKITSLDGDLEALNYSIIGNWPESIHLIILANEVRSKVQWEIGRIIREVDLELLDPRASLPASTFWGCRNLSRLLWPAGSSQSATNVSQTAG
jgi:hypothetical protein